MIRTVVVLCALLVVVNSAGADNIKPCPGYPGAQWLQGSAWCHYHSTSAAQCASVGGSYRSDGYCRFLPAQRDQTPSVPSASYSPGSYRAPATGNKLDAFGNILGGVAGMMETWEGARQREEEEARQRLLEAEMEQRAKKREETMRALEALKTSISNELRDEAERSKKDAAVAACVQQQSAALEEYMAAAQQCLADTFLIATADHESNIYLEVVGTDPSIQGRLAPPRWRISGTRASPVCDLPIKANTQYESFAECARLYSCAMQAADCTAQTVKRTGGDCGETARACLSRFPVPVNLAEGQTLPASVRQAVRQIWSGPGARRSHQGGISGPSGRGGPSIPSTSAK